MPKLLQLHFAFTGPFGAEMAEQLRGLAESINQEPGFIWKVWTESEQNKEAEGSIFSKARRPRWLIWKNIPRV